MKALLVGYGLALLALWHGTASAQIVIAVDAADPPFMYEDNGRAAGIYPALIAEAYRRMGVEASLTAVPWKRALEDIDNGLSGIGGLYKTTGRLEKYDYSGKLFDELLELYVLKGHGFPFTSIDSLKGHTIGVIRGWSYGDAFDEARRNGLFTTEEASGDAQNFAVLDAGHIDGIIAIREAATTFIARGHLDGRVEALPQPLSRLPTYVAFNKSSGKRDELQRFDAAIAEMRADGSFARIADRMFAP